jgi:hypothetical protein
MSSKLYNLIGVPDLTPEEKRELDRKAMEILLLLPEDLGRTRYVQGRIIETLDKWVTDSLGSGADDNIVKFKLVD